MKTLAASLVAVASLLGGACAPVISTLTPSPSANASASPSPSATASAVLGASPSAVPAFAPNPPLQYLDPNTLFVSSDAELVRSDDAGTTRTVIGAPPLARFVELRMIDRDHGWSVLFFRRDPPLFGCQQAANAAPCHGAVAVTNDGGRTWTVRLTSPLNAGGGISIAQLQAVDAEHAWVLVARPCDESVCDKELRATADGGLTWKTLRTGRLTQLRVVSLARAWLSADAGNGSVVHGTADGGVTWRQQLATEQPLIALDAASETQAWALTRDGAYCTSSTCQRYELLVTGDGGATWTSLANPKDKVAAGAPASCTFGHVAGPLFANSRIGWLGLSRGAGGVAGTGGIMRTDDGGRSWSCAVVPPDVEGVSAADPDHVIALSRDPQSAAYALWLSTDSGRTWTPILPR
jgi:photosystem II stability/assembly factor-like uncharacterized protein